MASLVQWLAYSGARKSDGTPVASGSAYFYQPGTTNTQIAVYSDADGLAGISQPVTLDASGRAEVYLMSPARVEVQDATGATVRLEDRANTITAAEVEIQNTVATGTSLTTGSQVAGGRTDLDTFLSNLYTSLGTQDGKVLISGAGQNIKDVIGGSTSIFFNVKVAPYSAVGDDSTDDTAAIQSAINAAATAGGGIVYFPAGTYKLTAALSVSSTKIQFLGVTPSAVVLKQYTATLFALSVTGTDFYCSNINFAMGAASAKLVACNSGDSRFVGCSFTLASATGTGISVTSASCRTTLVACTFVQSLATGNMLSVGNASAVIVVIGGKFTIPTASSSFIITGTAGTVSVVGAEINHAAASGTTNLVDVVSGITVGFIGCYLPATTGGTLQFQSGSNTATVYESGCFPLVNISGGATIPNLTGTQISATRQQLVLRTSGSATTYTPDFLKYGAHDVTSTGASFQFVNPTNFPSAGHGPFLLRYKNGNAGAITPTFGTNYKIGTVPSVASGSGAAWLLAFDTNGGVFYQVGGNSSAYAS